MSWRFCPVVFAFYQFTTSCFNLSSLTSTSCLGVTSCLWPATCVPPSCVAPSVCSSFALVISPVVFFNPLTLHLDLDLTFSKSLYLSLDFKPSDDGGPFPAVVMPCWLFSAKWANTRGCQLSADVKTLKWSTTELLHWLVPNFLLFSSWMMVVLFFLCNWRKLVNVPKPVQRTLS